MDFDAAPPRVPTWDEVNEDPSLLFNPDSALEIDDTRSWVSPDGYRLSDRIWKARAVDRRNLDKQLLSGLARGIGAKAISREVAAFLTPAGSAMRSRTPTGRIGVGNYAALRLSRTETTRSFGQVTLKASSLNPFVNGMRWLISGSHKDADICDENAAGHSAGLPPGTYTLEEVPRYPNHPHEMCTLAPSTVSDEEARAIIDGPPGVNLSDKPFISAFPGNTPRISDEQRTLLSGYIGNPDAFEINKALRTGSSFADLRPSGSTPDGSRVPLAASAIIRNLDRIIRAASLAEETSVYRGVGAGRSGAVALRRLAPGDAIVDAGFTSTTRDLGAASTWAGISEEAVIIEIRVPAGAPAYDVTKSGAFQWEDEVILPRGNVLQVDEVTRDDLGRRRIRASYIGVGEQ